MSIKQLREDYEDLVGRKPFNGWSEEKLQEKMAAFREEHKIREDVVVTKPRVAEVKVSVAESEAKSIELHTTRHETNEKIRRGQIYRQLFNLEPIFINRVPFALIGNEYVKWEKAELIGLKKIKAEIEQLIEEKTAMLNT